tara:strand:- start:250 stop:1020 length:771 start_codon:yes stop_codon:yes gene_type:complete
MTLFIPQVAELFYSFLWPFVRVSALFLTAPLFSLAAITVRVRIALSFALVLLIFPLLDIPKIDPLSAPGIAEVFSQAAIGAIAGLFLQVVNAAFAVGGQSISASMGLAMANMVDPNVGNVPVISQFLIIFGTLIFLFSGGHLILIQILVTSFDALPVGSSMPFEEFVMGLLSWSVLMFAGGLMIALPVIASLLFVNFGLGIITRSAPALNIFAIGFPALILGGIAILFLSMPGFFRRAESLWFGAFDRIRETLIML